MSRMLPGRGLSLAVAALGASLVVVPATGSNESLVAGAASAEHLWFVSQSQQPPGTVELCHHAVAMDAPHYRPLVPLTQTPEALAAWGERLWITFPPKLQQADPQRETYTLAVFRHPVLGVYETVPKGRFEIVEPLPGRGRLVGLVGTSAGPVALLVPSERAKAQVHAGDASLSVEPVLTEPRLLRLRHERWEEIPLPEGFQAGPDCHLAAGGRQGLGLRLVTSVRGDHHLSLLYTRDSSGGWTPSRLPLELHRVRSLVTVDGHVAAVLEGGADDSVEIVYLREASTLPLASFPRPLGRWNVFGLRDGFRILARPNRQPLRMRRVEPLSGRLGGWQVLTEQPLAMAPLWPMALLTVAGMAGLLIGLIFKPSSGSQVTLRPEVVRVGVFWRLAALLIDLAPGGLLAVVVLRGSLSDLLTLPVLTLDLEQGLPNLVMVGVTIAHSTLAELFTARTLGKKLLGITVVSADGTRPGARSVLIRNVFKGLTLLLPPIAVVAVINPHLQGIGDLLAATVVVGEGRKPTSEDHNDR